MVLYAWTTEVLISYSINCLLFKIYAVDLVFNLFEMGLLRIETLHE
jgi:hypothetical protein